MGVENAVQQPHERPEVAFRACRPEDLPAFAHMAMMTWPSSTAALSQDLELSGMEGYMLHSLRQANWTDVACDEDGTAVGFLFGRIGGYEGIAMPGRSMLGEVPTVLRSYLRKGGDMMPGLVSLAFSLVLTDLKLKILMPRSDASVEMFIVDPAHRGKGIGSALLERFLEAAERHRSNAVTLYTDDVGSDWQFYERRGFSRVGTFRDNMTSLYLGEEARGIIYVLDLRRRLGGDSADR